MRYRYALWIIICTIMCVLLLTACAAGGDIQLTKRPEEMGPGKYNLVFTNQTFTYDGAPHTIEVENVPSGWSVTYDRNTYTDAGTYPITARVEIPGDTVILYSAIMTIEPATPTVTVQVAGSFVPGTTAEFVAQSTVTGTVTSTTILEEGMNICDWTFIPESSNYRAVTGRATVGAFRSWENVIQIGTKEQLIDFMNAGQTQSFEGKTILLTADIVLNDTKTAGWESAQNVQHWTPVGHSATQPFSGTFEGGGHTITGLCIRETYTDVLTSATGVGMFGFLKNATVKNLALLDAYASVSYAAPSVDGKFSTAYLLSGGILVGGGSGSTVTGCAVRGTLDVSSGATLSSGGPSFNAGLLAGYMQSVVIRDCAVAGTMFSSGDTGVGLFFGGTSGGSVSNSYVCGIGVRNDEGSRKPFRNFMKWSAQSVVISDCYIVDGTAGTGYANVTLDKAKGIFAGNEMPGLSNGAFAFFEESMPFPVMMAAEHETLGLTDGATALTLAYVFDNHMVIQRNQPIVLYGTGAGHVTATIGSSTNAATFTGEKWELVLPPLAANAEAQTLTVTLGEKVLSLTDILIGDVWLAGGQSNMAMLLKSTDDASNNAENYESLRFYKQGTYADTWTAFTKESVMELSAIGYYFAEEIYTSLKENVPIGIISVNLGATRVESWTSAEYADREPYLSYVSQPHNDAVKYAAINKDHYCFNTYIKPLGPIRVTGVIWYQGESNRGAEEAKYYGALFANMVDCWRNFFGYQLPFFTVQIMPFSGGAGADEYNIRMAQAECSKNMNDVYLVTLRSVEDCLLADGTLDIHPTDKKPIGVALAHAALSELYRMKSEYDTYIEYSGPIYDIAVANGNRVTVTFTHVAEGLMCDGDTLTDIQVCGVDGVWHDAEALIEGNTLIAYAAEVAVPTMIQMGHKNIPTHNLYNTIDGQRGYLASPFCLQIVK